MQPMAVNCQPLSAVPQSRAMRRQMMVATDPVSSRPGPIAVAKMAAHRPVVPAVCSAAAGELGSAPAPAGRARGTQASETGQHAAGAAPPGYQVLEVLVSPGSAATGKRLGSIRWPAGSIPVGVLRHRTLHDPRPGVILAAGDRIIVLARTARPSPSRLHYDEPHNRQDSSTRMTPTSLAGDSGSPGD
jgi:TrkA-C domain